MGFGFANRVIGVPRGTATPRYGFSLRALSHRYRGVCILGRHATEGEPSR
jgi:hypothetical protein